MHFWQPILWATSGGFFLLHWIWSLVGPALGWRIHRGVAKKVQFSDTKSGLLGSESVLPQWDKERPVGCPGLPLPGFVQPTNTGWQERENKAPIFPSTLNRETSSSILIRERESDVTGIMPLFRPCVLESRPSFISLEELLIDQHELSDIHYVMKIENGPHSWRHSCIFQLAAIVSQSFLNVSLFKVFCSCPTSRSIFEVQREEREMEREKSMAWVADEVRAACSSFPRWHDIKSNSWSNKSLGTSFICPWSLSRDQHHIHYQLLLLDFSLPKKDRILFIV